MLLHVIVQRNIDLFVVLTVLHMIINVHLIVSELFKLVMVNVHLSWRDVNIVPLYSCLYVVAMVSPLEIFVNLNVIILNSLVSENVKKKINIKVIVISVLMSMIQSVVLMVLTIKTNVYVDAKVIVKNIHQVNVQLKNLAQDVLAF